MPRARRAKKGEKYLMISAVAERFDIHPQTLRLYEREGLLNPVRSPGNTRLYDEETLGRLETILSLTRDLGVNLAGVEVILNMSEQLERMQLEVDRLVEIAKHDLLNRRGVVESRYALVRIESGPLVTQDGD